MDIISYALSKGNTQKAVTDYLDEHLTNPTNPPIDTSLSIAGAAADSKKTGDEIGALKEDLTSMSLLSSNIEGTVKTVAFNSDGSVESITHTNITTQVVERTDVFTYGSDTITEVRTLRTGESVTITVNLNTLAEEVM